MAETMTEWMLNLAFACGVAAGVCGWCAFFAAARSGRLARGTRRGAGVLLTVGLVAASCAMGGRWYEAGRPPFASLFEGVVTLAWACFLISLFFSAVSARAQRRAPCRSAAKEPPWLPDVLLGVGGMVAAVALAACWLLDSTIRPLVPALQSNWLVFHVVTCFLGYAAFALAFALGLAWIVARIAGKEREAWDSAIEQWGIQTMKFGLLMLTLGILSGSVWARNAWGRYWGWDPKETWALVTAAVYALYLHFRLVAPRFGVRAGSMPAVTALFSVIGFAAVMFTLLGVSYLLGGLHSY